jgi:tetratricopeptide (TPR) repeat protein
MQLKLAICLAIGGPLALAAAQTTTASVPTPPPVAGTAAAAVPAPAPTREISTEMRGDIAMARKEYRRAIEYYQAVEPRTAVILNKIGIAHHQMMDLNGARKHYQQAAKMDKQYAEAVNNLGTIDYARKKYRGAVKHYNRALKLAPNSASIHSNLGTAWFARKKYDRAFAAYQTALELDPEVFEHRGSSGVLLQERSVEEKAKFHFYLAKTYASVGVFDRALQYIRIALEEGFKERNRLVDDPAFAAMQEMPEFQALLEYQPRVL